MVCDTGFCQLFDMKHGHFAKIKTVAAQRALCYIRQRLFGGTQAPQKRHTVIAARQKNT